MSIAPTRTEQPGEPGEPAPREHRRPLNPLRVDPPGLALCDEASFAAIVDRMVADEAPRLFAVVQEYGERVDGRIAAWGLAFPDHAEVVSAHGLRLSVHIPQHALRCFNTSRYTRARLVWCLLVRAGRRGHEPANPSPVRADGVDTRAGRPGRVLLPVPARACRPPRERRN